MVAGTYPGMIISAAQRQAALLHKAALAVRRRRRHRRLWIADFRGCIFRARPLWKQRCAISARRGWLAIMDQLATPRFEMRKQSSLAAVIAQRALMSIAVNARRRG